MIRSRAFAFAVLLCAVFIVARFAVAADSLPVSERTALLILPKNSDGKVRAIWKPFGNSRQAEIRKDEAPPGTLFTLLRRSPDGKVESNPLRPVGAIEARSITGKCLTSPRDSATVRLQQLNEKSLRELIEIRTKKRELLMTRIRSQLSGTLVEALRSYERRFGLRINPPLSAQLSDDALIWRLLSVRAMLLNEAT